MCATSSCARPESPEPLPAHPYPRPPFSPQPLSSFAPELPSACSRVFVYTILAHALCVCVCVCVGVCVCMCVCVSVTGGTVIFSNLVFFRIQSVDHAVVWSCASVYGLGGERERQRERERERARVRARGGQEEGCDGARGIVWARRAKRKQGLKQGARDASSIHTPALSQTTRLHGAEPGESQSPAVTWRANGRTRQTGRQ